MIVTIFKKFNSYCIYCRPSLKVGLVSLYFSFYLSSLFYYNCFSYFKVSFCNYFETSSYFDVNDSSYLDTFL